MKINDIEHIRKNHKEAARKYYDKEPVLIPDINSFIKEKFWILHEAVFALTESWPQFGLGLAMIKPTPKLLEGRDFVYLPCTLEFDPKDYPETFQDIFYELENDVKNGVCNSQHYSFCKGINFVLTPKDVIFWALEKGICFPDSLEKACGIFLHYSRYQENKIKAKITAQYLLDSKPMLVNNISNLIDDPLMYRFGSRDPKIDPTSIRKAINELFSSKGVRGRPTEIKSNRKYSLKPIPEVLIKQENVWRYNYLHLKVAISTLTQIKISLLSSEEITKISIDELIKSVVRDKIVKLYLRHLPNEILEPIYAFIGEKFSSLRNWISLPQQLLKGGNVNWKFEQKNS